MRQGRRSHPHLTSPTAWVAAAVAGCIAGVVVLSSSPAAQAEARSTTVTLTLTGMVDSSCELGTGGTTAYIAPGGTVTLRASLAGASVTLPGLGLLPGTTLPLDSSSVASFDDTVVVNGDTSPLTSVAPNDKIVLNGIDDTTSLNWTATSITLKPGLPGLLGHYSTVRLNADNVILGAGAALSWSGKIIPSNSTCGIAIAVPTIKASAASRTVTIPGVAVTATNPVPGRTSTTGAVVSSVVNRVTGGDKSTPAKGGATASAPNVTNTSSERTAPHKVTRHARISTGGGAAQVGGSAQGGGGVAPGAASTAPNASSGAGAPAKPGGKSVDATDRSQLEGRQLPALLAIAAILALALVTAAYARVVLLRRKSIT